MDSFLLIGQSNMAGRGIIGSVPPVDPRGMMFMLRNGHWVEMSEPINPDRRIFVTDDREYRSGISLAASFAEDYVTATGQQIGLIPCADGGTCVEQWLPDEVLFDHAVFQTRLAMRSSTLKGILWHQGESDSKSSENVASYAEKFNRMIRELIRRIGVSPEIPIVIGEITEQRTDIWPYAEDINRVLHQIAGQAPNIAVASAAGLVNGPDGWHFTGPSYRELGRRYFAAYQSLSAQR